MQYVTPRWIVAGIGFVVVGLLAVGDDSPPTERPESTSPRRGPTLMKRKLEGSQLALAGLVRGDLKQVERAARELHTIAQTSIDSLEKDAVYVHFNVEFQRLTEKLQHVAGEGNVDAAAYVHSQLTSTCISCHQHVRDVARLEPVPEDAASRTTDPNGGTDR